MSSMCRNYVKCLNPLEEQNNHNGLCLECHLACGKFIAEIEHLLSGHKLSTEDGIYLFLHRYGTLDDLARHLNVIKITDYLPSVGTLTKIRSQLQPVQTALICLRHRGTITAEELIELTTEIEENEPEEEEEKIDCTEDNSDKDIEEPILSEVCPIEVIPTKVIPTEEPAPEEIIQYQTPTPRPEVVEKPVDRVPITEPDCDDQWKTLPIIANIIDNRKLPIKCVEFVSDHMTDCKAAELNTLLGMTTCRYLASRGVIKNCYMAPPKRTGRGNHREVWMIPIESIILVCDKHFNWVTTPQAVIQLKKMYPDIVIDRNTLRKYVLKEGLCKHGTNLFGELAILVSILPEVSNRYREIQTRTLKNRGVHKDAPKPNELTPEQIFLLLNKKIPYKTVLDYLGDEILPGKKLHGRWISTTKQYEEFLQKATNGVRGMKPEHILVCREYLQKSKTITAEH